MISSYGNAVMSHPLVYGMMRDLYRQLFYVCQGTDDERSRMIERALRRDGAVVCRYNGPSRNVRVWYLVFPSKAEALLGWEYVR